MHREVNIQETDQKDTALVETQRMILCGTSQGSEFQCPIKCCTVSVVWSVSDLCQPCPLNALLNDNDNAMTNYDSLVK